MTPNYPELTDNDGWIQMWKTRYRSKSTLYLLGVILLSLPFCCIYWAAQKGQAAIEILCERDE